MSRNHRDAVFTDAPTWVQLPSGLWCTQYVSAQTNYCTVPDITELLGATAATWMVWVRKDAYIAYQVVASDYTTAGGRKKWLFGYEGTENRWGGAVGDGATTASVVIAGAFTTGWHFAWMRFTGGSATGLEAGCDSSVMTPVSTSTIAALGAVDTNSTFIGNWTTYYSSITLGPLGIAARALTDEQIAIWREKYRPLIGV
jgi:hypothetical protein